MPHLLQSVTVITKLRDVTQVLDYSLSHFLSKRFSKSKGKGVLQLKANQRGWSSGYFPDYIGGGGSQSIKKSIIAV